MKKINPYTYKLQLSFEHISANQKTGAINQLIRSRSDGFTQYLMYFTRFFLSFSFLSVVEHTARIGIG